MKNQKEVWDSIAPSWKEYKETPLPEVVEFLENKKGKILDLGCGTGRHFIKTNVEFYGVDFSEEMLSLAKISAEKNKSKVKLFEASADLLPFEDNFFDSAISIAVIHCIPEKENREKALKELLRVLKRNSETMIAVWNKDQEKFRNSKKESLIPWRYNGKEYQRYYYLYEKDEFVNLLEKIGFEVVKVMDKDNPTGLYSKRNIIAVVRKP